MVSTGAPKYEEIAMLAYHLYEADGRNEGKALEHWLTAEQKLLQEHLETPEQRLWRVAVVATLATAGGFPGHNYHAVHNERVAMPE